MVKISAQYTLFFVALLYAFSIHSHVNTKNLIIDEYVTTDELINKGSLKADSVSLGGKTVNEGKIEAKALLVDADFENKGYLVANSVYVTAGCSDFNTITGQLTIRDSLVLASDETKLQLNLGAISINALYKGGEYMGGIQFLATAKKPTATIIITDEHNKEHFFKGAAGKSIRDILNKALNSTTNVSALIAYLRASQIISAIA